jgi:4-hydroxybenzoate polyprenyltransferase
LLLRVTYWRTLVSGLVKASGPIAAIYVVEPNPAPEFLLLVFAWILFWEIGGQNVPADWNDTVEDQRVGAKTIPIQFGFQTAGMVILIALGLTVITSLFLPVITPLPLGWLYLITSALGGILFLIVPAWRLYRHQNDGRLAARLFDRASYYPLAQLTLIAIFALISS